MQDITPNNPVAVDLLSFTSKHLETDKLFFVLRSYLSVDDPDEKYLLMADLEGDFENLTTAYVDRAQREPIEKVLNQIIAAPQLQPQNRDEILAVLEQVQVFHGRAYDWQPNLDVREVF